MSGEESARPPKMIAFDALVFDEDRVTAFLHSVARVRAMAPHVKVSWKSYKESSVINVIYALMPWKGKYNGRNRVVDSFLS